MEIYGARLKVFIAM